MILSCVVPPPFPFPLPVLLPPHALSRRTKMMPVTRTNHRLCRLHMFIDCLLSVFAGHGGDQLKCCCQPIPSIGRFSCSSDTSHFLLASLLDPGQNAPVALQRCEVPTRGAHPGSRWSPH